MFLCRFRPSSNYKAKQDVYLPHLLSLEGEEGGQKAKASGTIEEIPENSSYIKNNLSNAAFSFSSGGSKLYKLV